MKLRSLLLTATVLAAAPVAAWAQPVDGLYIAGAGGVNWMQQKTLKSVTVGSGLTVPIGTSGKGKIDANNPGWAGLGSVGYGFGNGLRVELEGSYRNNGIHKVTAFGTSFAGGGQEQKYGPMVNAFYDFDVAPFFQPYVGIGAGYQITDWSGVRAYNSALNFHFTGTSGQFAFQPIIGAAFPLPSVPGLAFTLEYRFLDVIGNKGFKGSVIEGSSTTKVVANTVDSYNHAILLGVRYAFGAPQPPAPPAAVAAPTVTPARSYLVFFDWDKAVLTDRARQIIAEAAANIPKVQHTQIEVNGYTDTSGTPKYNLGLSIRRAQAVAAELVRLGVAKSEIAIHGFGDTRLLVPTGPGVREPQNRRVEIIIK